MFDYLPDALLGEDVELAMVLHLKLMRPDGRTDGRINESMEDEKLNWIGIGMMR